MITEIGIIAGEIWHYLDTRGEVGFQDVVAGIKRPRELAFMSLGWLAREGHALVRQDGQEFRVALRR